MKHPFIGRKKTQKPHNRTMPGNLSCLSFLCCFEFFAAIQNEVPQS